MSLRGKLTEEAPTERQFDEVSELDKELERTEILRAQLLTKKYLAMQKEKHLVEGNVYDGITDDMEGKIQAVIKKIDYYHDRNEFLKETIALIYILHQSYERVFIHKPCISRYSNSEKYIVINYQF